MTHLGWYYFGRKLKVPSQLTTLTTNEDGEWVRLVPRNPNRNRTVKTMCNIEVGVTNIVEDIERVECSKCKDTCFNDLYK